MKYIRLIPILVIAATALLLGGCASMSSNIAPGADLTAIKKIHVVRLPADQRGINQLLADRLSMMGYQATTGEANNVPPDASGVLTYQDKWMWDITMYMLQLDVQLREPKTDIALATAKSYRPSLQRKSPSDMVEEVLNQLLRKR